MRWSRPEPLSDEERARIPLVMAQAVRDRAEYVQRRDARRRGAPDATLVGMWEPREGDVCVPKHTSGYTIVVVDSSADRVVYQQVVDGDRSNSAGVGGRWLVPWRWSIVVRLSTFLDRFELLHRPGT